MITPEYITTDFKGNELTEEEFEQLEEHKYRGYPFIKWNWKDARSRDSWKHHLQTIVEAQYATDVYSVTSDRLANRDAAQVIFENEHREKITELANEVGLTYLEIDHGDKNDGFSHLMNPGARDKLDSLEESITRAVIADKEVAKVVDELYGRDDEDSHRELGRLFGIPECCIEFYIEQAVKEDRIDPLYEVACNTEDVEMIDGDPTQLRVVDPEPWNNVLWRYFGWSYINHIPCSFDCEESKEIAKARGNIMAENGYRVSANALFEWLQKPMTWASLKSLAHIKNENVTSSAQSSCYWDEKYIVWGEEHDPESVV